MHPEETPFGGQPAGGRGGVRSTRPSGDPGASPPSVDGSAFGADPGSAAGQHLGAEHEGAGGQQTLLSLGEAAKAVGTSVQALWGRVQRGELAIHRVEQDGRTSTAVALADILRLYMNHVPGDGAPPGPPQFSGGSQIHVAPSPPAGASPFDAGHAVQPEQDGHAPAAPGAAPFSAVPGGHEHGVQQEREPFVYEVPRPRGPAPVPPAEDHAYPRERGDVDAQVERLRDELLEARTQVAQAEGKLNSMQEIETSVRRYSERLEQRLEQTEKELSEAKREALTLARALGQAEGQVLQLSGGKDGADPDAPRPRRKRRWWRKRR